jgi:hypothetical protein
MEEGVEPINVGFWFVVVVVAAAVDAWLLMNMIMRV